MLPRCLAAVRDAVDELVIVDTGSKDRTREIALRVRREASSTSSGPARSATPATSPSTPRPATGSCSSTPTRSSSRATASACARCAGQTWREAHYLLETNHTGTLEDGTAVTHNALRVFRNRPGLRFEGRIHEQIAQHLPAFLPERLARLRRAHRPLRLPRRGPRREGEVAPQHRAARAPGRRGARQPVPRIQPRLGVRRRRRHAPPRWSKFESAWARVRNDQHIATYGFVPSLAGRLVRALRVTGPPRGRARARRRGPAHLPGLHRRPARAGDRRRRAGRPRDRDRRARALPGVGRRAEHVLRDDGQRHVPARWRRSPTSSARAGDLDGAEELLRTLPSPSTPVFLGHDRAAHPPRCSPAARTPEEAVAAAEADGELPLVRALHARRRALRERRVGGRRGAAPPRARGPAGRRAARVALGEALLSQSRFAEAADVARVRRPSTRPGRRAAARHRGVRPARRGGRRRRGPRRPGAGPARPGCRTARRARCEAWVRPRAPARRPSAGSVPAGAAALTLTMLEALLRLQDFELFAQLLPVVDALALTARDRRELLARMYLRRGFLESAGDEWVAAIQEDGRRRGRARRASRRSPPPAGSTRTPSCWPARRARSRRRERARDAGIPRP